MRAEDDLVGQVPDRGLVGRRDDMVLRDDGDGGLGVERDRVQPVPVDRQPDHAGVHRAVPDLLHHLVRARAEELEGDVGTSLGPDPRPLARRGTRDVAEPEGRGPARLGHGLRLAAGRAR